MTVLALKNVVREPGAIYYIRRYRATANLKLPTEIVDSNIEFSIETGPLGDKIIDVELVSQPNYPALPIVKALKEYINENDNAGTLPI
ncbi:MAG: hypothetical protein IJL24_05965 [Treponema sp.]|nr:hypothetical protein [Treponema sp.]